MTSDADRPSSVPPLGDHLDSRMERPHSSQGRLSQLITGRASRSRASSISSEAVKAEVTDSTTFSEGDGHVSRRTKGGRGESGRMIGLQAGS
jgi:hypothetical protein